MSWTLERVGDLTRMWSRGLTAQEIADELGGVTRNAVVGKAHRLELERDVDEAKLPPEPETEPELPPHLPSGPNFEPMPEVKSWMCLWPLDEPGRFGLHICGRTTQPSRYYCAEHLTTAYLKKKRKAA